MTNFATDFVGETLYVIENVLLIHLIVLKCALKVLSQTFGLAH